MIYLLICFAIYLKLLYYETILPYNVHGCQYDKYLLLDGDFVQEDVDSYSTLVCVAFVALQKSPYFPVRLFFACPMTNSFLLSVLEMILRIKNLNRLTGITYHGLINCFAGTLL